MKLKLLENKLPNYDWLCKWCLLKLFSMWQIKTKGILKPCVYMSNKEQNDLFEEFKQEILKIKLEH